MSIRRRHSAAILISRAAVAPAVAQERLGSEFRVNSYTTGVQDDPAVAVKTDGSFVVVWAGPGHVGHIYGQRYDASGISMGGEFQVSTYTPSPKWGPSLAVAAGGGFVWSSMNQDGSYYGIFGQLHDASGQRVGTEFQVNSYTTGTQFSPAVASDSEGNFVVVWDGGYFPLTKSWPAVTTLRAVP